MLEVLGEAALRTVLLAAVVKLGLWLLRIRRAQLLLIAWTVILAASLAMPALQWATPLRLPVVPSIPSTILIDAEPQPQASTLETPRPSLATDIQEPSTIRPWLEAVYLVVSSILLLRVTVGLALSLRMLGKAAPVAPDWAAKDGAVKDGAAKDGAAKDGAANAHIRISRLVAAPVTVANVILLPADAADWPAAMRQAVLAHERTHVARRDFAMLLLSQVNRAVFWFSPLSWWLHRRLAALAELASDDHAMEVTGDRSGYAEVLLEMGRRSGPTLRGLAMARQATLRYRIERILSERVTSAPVSPAQQLILAIGAAGLSIGAASPDLGSALPVDMAVLTEQQTPPGPPSSPPAQAARDVPPSRLPPLRIKSAPEAPQHSGPSVPSELPATVTRSRPGVRTVARPWSNPVARASLAMQSSHTTRQSSLVRDQPVAVGGSLGAEAANSGGTLPHTTVGPDPANRSDAAAEHQQASILRAAGYLPEREQPVLRLLNDQTCAGFYVPQRAAGLVGGGVNVVRAKFFQDASGTPWLTFFPGGQTPVIQPVTVTHGEDKLTASSDIVFTVVPSSARHLDGFIKRSYGTIDFDCGGSDAHLFDGAR